MPSQEVLIQRRDARDYARGLMAMLQEEATNIPAAARESYWDELRVLVAQQLPAPTAVSPAPLPPLSEEDARVFERAILQFGIYSGYSVGTMMADAEGRRYLQWLAGDTFQERLRRYLLTPSIARALRE